jgi:hypothetical protein
MMHKGTVYRIVVQSELSNRYAVAFEGMEMETKHGETILKLVSVQTLPEDAHPSAGGNREPKEPKP